MPKTILILDAEQGEAETLSDTLKEQGYTVLAARNGKQAVELARQLPDLIVLEVKTTRMDDWTAFRQLKSAPETSGIPCLFLAAESSEQDEVLAFALGADDYVAKPSSTHGLLARIKALIRRGETRLQPAVEAVDIIRIADFEIDIPGHTVKVGHKEVVLTKKEFQILVYLASHHGKVISRGTLLNEIWGKNVCVVARAVDVHIGRLREKLGPYASHIETKKCVGYRFTV